MIIALASVVGTSLNYNVLAIPRTHNNPNDLRADCDYNCQYVIIFDDFTSTTQCIYVLLFALLLLLLLLISYY